MALLIPALWAGAYFRASGLFRGLEDGIVFHPDTPKQVLALSNYLHGNYVQYFDSLFYDGYPYGLNRADEILIRPAYAVTKTVATWLRPDIAPDRVPPRTALFRWARTLRVVYGLTALLLIYATARRLGFRKRSSASAAWLYALAPLASTVTHSASGDVGVDLFMALALWCMAGYATRGTARWVAAAGAACGMAFACKYQGMLGLWVVGMTPLLTLKLNRASMLDLLRKGMAALAGLAGGILLLTPAYFINPEKTWKDTVANFKFIRNYGVSPDFLEQPLAERVVHGLSRNLPAITGCLGWLLAIATLSALIMLAIRHIRESPTRSLATKSDALKDHHSSNIHALLWAVASFPIMALLLSTALKPAVQPFHFSYLLPFMALSAGWLLDQAMQSEQPAWRIAAQCLVLGAMAEALVVNRREDFFWRRGETYAAALRFAEGVFVEPPPASRRYCVDRALKHFHAEPSLLPVFRNRSAGIAYPHADRWRERSPLPVPCVPLSEEQVWIFVNGPVFPRSDRMFFVPASAASDLRVVLPSTRRTLVFETPPPRLRLGIRSGRLPARMEAFVSGARQTAWLPPHSQTVMEWTSIRPVHGSEDQGRSAYPVPLRIRSELGPIWATVLDKDDEYDVFLAYGPDAEQEAARLAREYCGDTLQSAMRPLRYVEYAGPPLDIPSDTAMRLLDVATPLAGGAYAIQATVVNNAPRRQTVRLDLTDLSGHPVAAPPYETLVEPGLNRIAWSFIKSFVPYDAPLRISAEKEGLQLVNWTLAPDPDRLGDWLNRPPAPAVLVHAPDTNAMSVVYPGLGQWRGFALPSEAKPGERIRYAAHFELNRKIGHKTFHETVVFLHLKDQNGQRVMALDYPLRKTALHPSRMAWQTAKLPLGLAPGRYRLDAGLYNSRTRKRHAFLDHDAVTANRKRRYFQTATIDILPAADSTRP